MKYLFKYIYFLSYTIILTYAWEIIPALVPEEDADDWKLCRVFPDDVIIHPIFDWSAGKVHLWFDKVVDSVMCHLLLHVIYVGYEAELTLI